MSAIRLKTSRAPSSSDGFDPMFLCRHRECPLYKAPPCFSRRLEELLSSRSCCETNYPDWKQFTRHFKINIPVGEIGVVKYWVNGHRNKNEHTIQRVLDFAEKEGHPPLLHQFQDLIEVHKQANPEHVCTGNPADCFNFCGNCVPELEHRGEEEKAMDENKPSGSVLCVPGGPKSYAGAQIPPLLPDVLPGCDEVIHVLAPSLFEKEYPYKLFLGNYWILEPIIVLFLAYQTISSIFFTLFENGGAYAVFSGGLNAAEFINRIITLLLRILVRVLAPFIFYRQICSMAEAEKALEEKKKKDDYTLPSPNPVPYHKHVDLWSIISHAVIFSLLLLYLGAFLTTDNRLKDRSIFIKLLLFEMPLIGMRLFEFFDCLACFFILMLVGLVKDCYCIENRLSTARDIYFEIIRKRWYRIDIFCYTIPLLLISFTVVSLSYNKPITPAPDHQLHEGELEIWCFWMIVLPLLQFFGSSSNSTAKLVTVIGNVLVLFCAFLFTTILGAAKASFPPGSSVIHYSFLSMTTLNLLYCLTKAHARHKSIMSKHFWLSLSSLVFLVISLFAIVIREVISLAIIVSWT